MHAHDSSPKLGEHPNDMEPKITFNKNESVRRKRRARVMVVLLLFILAIIATAIGFLRKPTFQISQIIVKGIKSLDSTSVQSAAQKHISGFYALVIPKTNALLFSKTSMNNFLVQAFPGIQSADTEFSDRNILTISIVEKKPAYLWCTSISCYFVDDSGVVYQDAPTFTPGIFIDFSGITPTGTITDPTKPIRERFASVAEFNQSVSVVNSLESYPMHVIGVRHLSIADSTATFSAAPGDTQLTVDQIQSSVISNDASIYILQTQSAQEIARALDLVLANKNFQTEFSATPNELQYIDLRFAGKIYYKFANAGAVTSTVTPTTTISAPATTTTNPASLKLRRAGKN